ncbi:hypothetical protein VTP01DRAFT_2547 [Rhizomucor pusillus]|uniref:uncharacterized protein n=1 Tax=Rhizomucor pusillus TaxID=4840 RepID=UPI003743C8C2
MSRRGAFIVVEGCDRSGKSTQCARLAERLDKEGHRVQLIKFPDRTTQTGQMIDSYLKRSSHLDDHAIHLLFSANRWEAMKAIEAQLKAGTTLIVDRYAYSGVAFSSAKGLDLEWCKNPDRGLLQPDLVLFLDLPIEEAQKRGGFGDERYETLELQTKVRSKFLELREYPWKTIQASKSMDDVHEDMWEAVVKILEPSLSELKFNLWQ